MTTKHALPDLGTHVQSMKSRVMQIVHDGVALALANELNEAVSGSWCVLVGKPFVIEGICGTKT